MKKGERMGSRQKRGHYEKNQGIFHPVNMHVSELGRVYALALHSPRTGVRQDAGLDTVVRAVRVRSVSGSSQRKHE